MGENLFPFRRMTRAVLVDVAATAGSTPIDPAIYANMNAFMVTNPNQCWVGLRGTSKNQDGTSPASPLMAQADGADWLFPPGFVGVFSTQNPVFMSAIALPMPGYDLTGLTFTPLRIYYGLGA